MATESSTLDLTHCQAEFFSHPEKHLILQRENGKIKLSDWSTQTLFRIWPTLLAKIREYQSREDKNLKDHIISSHYLSSGESYCVKFEASVYQEKIYIFVKAYFKDKKGYQANVDPCMVKDEIMEEFEKIVEGDNGNKDNWIPRSNPIRLEIDDMDNLRHFILSQYRKNE